jgi:hypothetical protein
VVSFKTVRVLPNEGEAVGKFENEKLVYAKVMISGRFVGVAVGSTVLLTSKCMHARVPKDSLLHFTRDS